VICLVQSHCEKYFAFDVGQISGFSPPVSPDKRGGSRSSRTRGEMRWTRMLRLTSAVDAYGKSVWSRRPGAGVKWRGCFCATMVATKPVTRESAPYAVKPLRREGRMFSAEPVCSCACSYAHIARETAGAARIRLSLHPLFSKRVQIFCKPRAPCAARRWSYVLERRHCERSEAIHTFLAARWIASLRSQ
jgi:hypothetical protein